MKKIIYLPVAFLLMFVSVASQAKAENPASNDTTFYLNNKKIIIDDKDNDVKVRVFEYSKNDTVPYVQIYEGIYSDSKTYEKYTVIEDVKILPFTKYLNIKGGKGESKPRRCRNMEAHWAGLGFGFTSVADKNLNINNINGVSLVPEKSHEWTLNIVEEILPVFGNVVGITTGLGMTWRNYALDYNERMTVIDGYTEIVPALDHVIYNKSKLRTFHFTIPALIEIQPIPGHNKDNLYFVAGVVGGIKASGTYITKYQDRNGDKRKFKEKNGMNTRLLSLDCIAKVGWKDVSIYAKYSPISIFKDNRGPGVQSVSAGLMLEF